MRLALTCLLALTIASAGVAAAEHARPQPPELVSPPPNASEPLRVSRADRAVRLSWSTPPQDFPVEYYLVVWARVGERAHRIIATYANPPFTFVHPQFGVVYAWRVTAVDVDDVANIAASQWASFVIEPAD